MRRIAYADPPYIGCGHRYPEKVEVDHEYLIADLGAFDTWALSCHTPSLQMLLGLCPSDVRVCAWVKPFCAFKPNVNPAFAWEPVIVRGLPRLGRGVPTVRDYISANITLKKGLCGAKPPAFNEWLCTLLGVGEDTECFDLFPGTGGFGEACLRRGAVLSTEVYRAKTRNVQTNTQS